jgi:uncharacterized protein YvpB
MELECINHSMKFSKTDFVGGHLDFIAKKFGSGATRTIDNDIIRKFMKNNIKTHVIKQKVTVKLIDTLVEKKPIIYLDSYCLYKNAAHMPHFVTVLGADHNNYFIYDPWDGKKKYVSKKIIAKAVSCLRNRIVLCPQIIIIEKKN